MSVLHFIQKFVEKCNVFRQSVLNVGKLLFVRSKLKKNNY